MDHDLAGLLDNPAVRLSTPQIKTYLKQLLEGTAYLHHVSQGNERLVYFGTLLYTLVDDDDTYFTCILVEQNLTS